MSDQWVIADDEDIIGYAPALCTAFGQVRSKHGLAPPYTKQKMRAGDYAVTTADGRTLYLIREDVAARYASDAGWPIDGRTAVVLENTGPRP